MKKRILVVEDEAALRLAYEEELKLEGYEVLTARNGKEALSSLKKEKPDLIILDIIMPEMGWRVIQRHGGRVWAEGNKNEGATFYFSLPS